jgi:hypothetical protein
MNNNRSFVSRVFVLVALSVLAALAFAMPAAGRPAVLDRPPGELAGVAGRAMAGVASPPIAPSATFTPDTGTTPNLFLSIGYQGHGPAGTLRWRLPVTVALFAPGTSLPAAPQCEALTDSNGGFACYVPISIRMTVDIQVKNRHTLSNKRANVLFVPGTTVPISMGVLLEGDANGDDRVSLRDYSLFRSLFGQVCPSCHLPGDFNEDGVVAADDFLLLAANYTKNGPNLIAVAASQAAADSDERTVPLTIQPGDPPGDR